MDVLRDTWEAREDSEESVVSYVLLMQEILAKMTELVQKNIGRAQKIQKTCCDRNACLKSGDSVLVLLPNSTSKLRVQWQGTYKV